MENEDRDVLDGPRQNAVDIGDEVERMHNPLSPRCSAFQQCTEAHGSSAAANIGAYLSRLLLREVPLDLI